MSRAGTAGRLAAAAGDVEDGAPMPADEAVRPAGETAADLTVEPFPLPCVHGDVPGEGVEQADVALGVIDAFPVEVADVDDVEQSARLDLGRAVRKLPRAGEAVPGGHALADLVVDVLDLGEERVAAIRDDV